MPTNAHLDERSRRAREEPMAVHAFGTTLYEVETETGHTYLVDVATRRCTCPDHAFRDERCKHLRRVAIEITEGSVPPPGHRAVTCAVCADGLFVPVDALEPHLCERHRFERGDLAVDRETGGTVLVLGVSPRHADEVRIPAHDCTVAEYATNRGYPADDPVVSAVFPTVDVERGGVKPDSLRVYTFPVSRLTRAEN
ncbi:SWIM zinc finger family protein [Haloarchaeobius sp. DFWS5]|uniref:SWIM zinc finger family protein n=1 Tax=Haloarchaeobius sp. DFWS5 TaxID=3446114 RepID=UPI003EB9A8C1